MVNRARAPGVFAWYGQGMPLTNPSDLRRSSVAKAALALVVGASLGCGFVGGEAGSDGGTCSQTATCDPEGLLLFVSWAQGAGWPSTPTQIHVHHAEREAPVVLDCEGGPGTEPNPLACAPRCDAGSLDAGVCTVALPMGGGDDPVFGALLHRHLEVWVEVEAGRPVVRALEAVRHELRDVRQYPRVLDVTFHDDVSAWSWTFSPPNVHIDASATGTLACPVEQCDGQFVHVEVSALEPVT